MNLFRSEHLKELIIDTLLQISPQSGKDLLGSINKQAKYSKQGMYKSLNNLIEEKVVLKQGTQFLINNLWKEKLIASLSPSNILPNHLEEGDSIALSFFNPLETDRIWAHYFLQAYSETNGPVFIYDPHEWFMVAHKESEEAVFNKFNQDKRRLCVSVAKDTENDLLFAKKYRSDFISINTGLDYKIPTYEYVNVLGDYVFEAQFTVGFAEDLDGIYETSDTEKELVARVTELVNGNHKVKLRISRNIKKAEAYTKKFSKDFIL
ncbi:MAG TPA: hypothetical protein VGE63_03195 [Candidatus Paceibacterota bacterium]